MSCAASPKSRPARSVLPDGVETGCRARVCSRRFLLCLRGVAAKSLIDAGPCAAVAVTAAAGICCEMTMASGKCPHRAPLIGFKVLRAYRYRSARAPCCGTPRDDLLLFLRTPLTCGCPSSPYWRSKPAATCNRERIDRPAADCLGFFLLWTLAGDDGHLADALAGGGTAVDLFLQGHKKIVSLGAVSGPRSLSGTCPSEQKIEATSHITCGNHGVRPGSCSGSPPMTGRPPLPPHSIVRALTGRQPTVSVSSGCSGRWPVMTTTWQMFWPAELRHGSPSPLSLSLPDGYSQLNWQSLVAGVAGIGS
jgi:hypothetical protein